MKVEEGYIDVPGGKVWYRAVGETYAVNLVALTSRCLAPTHLRRLFVQSATSATPALLNPRWPVYHRKRRHKEGVMPSGGAK